MADDDGPVADPAVADSVRNRIRVNALGAIAEPTAKIAAPRRPRTNTRL